MLLTGDNQVTYQKQSPVTGQDIPRVLPFARTVHINLNFLTGAIPNWLLFHPYFDIGIRKLWYSISKKEV